MLLDIIEALSYRPLITVNASPAAVYRAIGTDDPPTLLIDEADTIFGPRAGDNHEDLRGLLNAGHQRNRPAIRYDASRRCVEQIPTFAMAALAGIGTMPDTIEDRAVVIRMRRRAPGEEVAPYRHRRDHPALTVLAGQLRGWVRGHADQLEQAVPLMPVEDRAADTWEPLVAVADLAGADWPYRARRAAAILTADRENNTDMPLRVRLLADCRTAFGSVRALSTVLLLGYLKADPEAPWIDHGTHGLTARRMATMLREYDINSANVRLADGTQAKGYLKDHFTDAWNRYCPRPDPGNPAAGEDAETPGAVLGRYPSQASQPSQPRPARDGSKPWDGKSVPTAFETHPWDGLAVPPPQSVPGLTWAGTAGTDRDGPAPQPSVAPGPGPICIGCRHLLTYDDGTHTHPGCPTHHHDQEANHV